MEAQYSPAIGTVQCGKDRRRFLKGRVFVAFCSAVCSASLSFCLAEVFCKAQIAPKKG